MIPLLDGDIRSTREACGHALEVRLNGADSGECDVYKGDGVSFDFQNGAWRKRRIRVLPDSHGKATTAETILHDQAGPLFGPVRRVVRLGK